MTVDTALYLGTLNTAIPANSDQEAEGAANLRQIKTAGNNSFPNVTGAVTATHTELNYSVGVTSGIQAQINAAVTSTTTATGATLWVSGTTYALGAFVYSPLNARNYRKITASSVSSTDPSLDATNWTDPASLSGTAAGTVDLLTGANIASAATVNLNTATGNRVHITGTTTITAVTLTRGPRTVVFDGVLTLTHHATNNNLPGAANITTAAGDRAIYESDGTSVYCVSYIRASGLAVVSALTLLATLTPTAAANLDFLSAFSSSYDNYLIVIDGVNSNAAATDVLQLRVANAGVVDAGANYSGSTSAITVSGSATSANTGVSGGVELLNVNSASAFKACVGQVTTMTGATAVAATTVNAGYMPITAVSGFRLFWSSGSNFTAVGKVRVYGYSNT